MWKGIKNIDFLSLFPYFSAQSQMMGRAAAGAAFYSPFHSMWTGFSNSNSQKYSSGNSAGSTSAASASGQNFGYPPTPPKDSSTPDQPLSEDNGYGHHMNNNNVVTANNSVSSETKPSTEHLMNSISSLSAYAGLPGSSASRKLPEGTNSSQQYSEGSMFYYPTSSDLAMYGSSSYGNRPHTHSRPKSKNRSNAGNYHTGKKNQKLTGAGGFSINFWVMVFLLLVRVIAWFQKGGKHFLWHHRDCVMHLFTL